MAAYTLATCGPRAALRSSSITPSTSIAIRYCTRTRRQTVPRVANPLFPRTFTSKHPSLESATPTRTTASPKTTFRTAPIRPTNYSAPASTTKSTPSPSSASPAISSAAAAAAATNTAAPATNTKPLEDETATESANGSHRSLTDGLNDPAPLLDENERQVDWTRSFHGLSSSAFTPEQAEILQQELDPDDIEVKPDGIVYLPEIKYRRILNKAFGPGGWGLAPRGETIVTAKIVTREYGLVAGGRLISVARGEQQYFDPDGIPTATEGCKSNALMRCCKDLGVASELWDPRFLRKFMASHVKEIVAEHSITKKRRKFYLRKDDSVRFPFKEVPSTATR